MIFRRLLLILIATAFISANSCNRPVSLDETKWEITIVRIPPRYDPTLKPGENQCRFREFLFRAAQPPDYSERCAEVGLANDDSLLYVTMSDDGTIALNGLPTDRNKNTSELSKQLAILFEERKMQGVFEPESDRIIKAVGIKVPTTAKYGDLIKLLMAVRDSGADPIVLLLDGHLPYLPLDKNK